MSTTFFLSIILITIFIFTLGIAVNCFIDLWREFADERKQMKKSVKDWYKKTRLFMWSSNRKNGITIISEKEYNRMLKNGEIKYVVIEEEG